MANERKREEERNDPDVTRAAERFAGQPERPDLSPESGDLDERLRKSSSSPNELDQSDESRKAADIKRAGEASARQDPGQ